MDLNSFKKFAKGGEKTKEDNRNVMIYTRVPSKEQATNYSLDNQEIAAVNYAQKHGYIITQKFGGTYESASGDFTRKEFSRLIKEVKNKKETFCYSNLHYEPIFQNWGKCNCHGFRIS